MKIAKTFGMGILIASGIFATAQAAEEKSSFSPQQREEIKAIVREYLVNNPEILVESAKTLQKQVRGKQEEAATSAIRRYSVKLFASPSSPTAGNPRGDVNVVEFFDYQCSYCKPEAPMVFQVMKNDPSVRVIFKELPIFGSDSEYAARAALASNKQGKYLMFHEALMKSTKPMTQDNVLAIAKSVGLNVKQLQEDMGDKLIDQQIAENKQLAEAIGVVGTPSFVIATNPVIDPKAKVKSFFISGAANQDTLKKFVANAREK